MKKYTVNKPLRPRKHYMCLINDLIEHMDVRQLMKLYAFAHRMMRDKVK